MPLSLEMQLENAIMPGSWTNRTLPKMVQTSCLVSRPRDFALSLSAEPCVNLSVYTAPITQPCSL